ncbi:MAG: heavy metal translocating P-type ATPase [Tissierellia bacterium]|nr:heavy metal translocating P-type ATPase [Tissierellia bacterium]
MHGTVVRGVLHPKYPIAKVQKTIWRHVNFKMNHLHCAICGGKIAALFGREEGVLEADYSLATGILWAHLDEEAIDTLYPRLIKIAKEVDPYVKVEIIKETKEKGWKLLGLHCANCAEKIVNQLNEFDEINHANFSMATENLSLDLKPGVEPLTLKHKIQHLVDEIEPGVKVIYQGNDFEEQNWKIKDLSCENCAGKIVDRINKLSYIKDANFSLATEGLHFQLKAGKDPVAVQKTIQEICDDIEPGVLVISPELSKDRTTDSTKKERNFLLTIGGGILAGLLGKFVFTQSPLQGIIFAIALVLAGGSVYRQAYKNIKRGEIFDENFLMSIATIGAYFIGEYVEALAVMVLYQIGELLQDKAVSSSRDSISSLLTLKAEYANVFRDGEWVEEDPEDVLLGERILVRPGEKIPLDGVIISGESFIDTSNITGESVPRKMGVGDEVHSGCLNGEGLLELEVTTEYGDGTVARILQLVESAATKKSKIEYFITKFARVYTPIVVAIAGFLVVAMPLITKEPLSKWIYQACIFLILSCPCALVISVPLGVFGGVGAASKKGVFVKGGNYLEALHDISMVAFDKTGTITKGVYEVSDIEPVSISKDELLEVVALGEYYSNHPIAKAIVNKYGKEEQEVLDYREIPGKGITFVLQGDKILAGNAKLLKDHGIVFTETDKVGTIIYVARNQEYLGYLLVRDTLKDHIKSDMKNLHDLGIETIMLSGDDHSVANAIAQEVGIDKAYGNLLPEDKVAKIEELMKPNENHVAFVGDGVNDAPVLARADVGIAMGKLGSDAAVETADVILMNDEIGALVDAFKISSRTRRIVLQNIIFALGIKIIVLILGLFGIATMWSAIFADVGVTVLAVFNSMRVLRVKEH